ncbi:MAG: hypothetical protein JSW56_11900 [Deltaproteobacteria bacterium]|nr:MAG: hypothetical protein JSW56_11900 [Deltaproteobacteria bacterium]
MNWFLIIAGGFAGLATVGHFAIGSRSFLGPTLQASFDEVPKKVMHCLFHYVSGYLILSTIFLLAIGLGFKFGGNPALLVRFIALNYVAFAVAQIIIALTSNIQNPLFKLFQWILWTLIALFSWIGT